MISLDVEKYKQLTAVDKSNVPAKLFSVEWIIISVLTTARDRNVFFCSCMEVYKQPVAHTPKDTIVVFPFRIGSACTRDRDYGNK